MSRSVSQLQVALGAPRGQEGGCVNQGGKVCVGGRGQPWHSLDVRPLALAPVSRAFAGLPPFGAVDAQRDSAWRSHGVVMATYFQAVAVPPGGQIRFWVGCSVAEGGPRAGPGRRRALCHVSPGQLTLRPSDRTCLLGPLVNKEDLPFPSRLKTGKREGNHSGMETGQYAACL